MALFNFKKRNKEEAIKKKAEADFELYRKSLEEMYKSDTGTKNLSNKNINTYSQNINTADLEDLQNSFFNGSNIESIRQYSRSAYRFYPIYSNFIDSLANRFLFQYKYVPRLIKESGDFKIAYEMMGEVVEGINIETVFPQLLQTLFIDGTVNFAISKNTSSKTLTTRLLNPKYCRTVAQTQYGTSIIEFDFSYFDSLGLTRAELESVWYLYPDGMKEKYEEYKAKGTNFRWQRLDPKFFTGISCNDLGIPTLFKQVFSLKRYDLYQQNELDKNTQQIEKIISHEMPNYQGELLVDIPEMKELHNSIKKQLSPNKNVKLVTTLGKMQVLPLSEEGSKDVNTLINAYKTVYNDSGANNDLFVGNTSNSTAASINRDDSLVWNYIQQLQLIYNLSLNNLFNFKGYQCNISILPTTHYNRAEMQEILFKNVSMGISKLDFIIASGNKQIDINDSLILEKELKLDRYTPFSTAYTQTDNKQQEQNKDNEVNTDE